jgi:hypothetical protein
MLNAQILNFIASLRDRIAEASQNHGRNPNYPEIPKLSKRDHVSSGKFVVPGCVAISASYHSALGQSVCIESRIGSQYKLLLSEN